jgi:hypothetical protein
MKWNLGKRAEPKRLRTAQGAQPSGPILAATEEISILIEAGRWPNSV